MTTQTPLTKDSLPVIYELVECARCGIKSYMGFLTFRDADGNDYLYEDSHDGWTHCLSKEYVYVCYDCDWKLMNGYGMQYDDEEALEDEEEARW